MLIIANTLEVNGGTTFILRFCRESLRRGKKLGVLVMMDGPDSRLLEEIEKYADVYFLSSFIRPIFRRFSNTPVVGFLPFDVLAVSDVFRKHGNAAHVMGVFGLLFLSRFVVKAGMRIKASAGVYHQNEFMFLGVNYYFAREAQRLFRLLGKNGVVFFNEANMASYSRFFDVDFSGGTLVPIGVDLPVFERPLLGDAGSRRIVSVGNLHEFKSYNSHIISCINDLRSIDNRFIYEIYGEGEYEKELREQAAEQGVLDFVAFKGRIPYAKLTSVLDGAFLFVGSGTAIIEAAAVGVPALIGIESTQQPITYGFLCDIEGFSYNEFESERSTLLMIDKIREISDDESSWRSVAVKCKEKAESFSIRRTVEGFFCQANLAPDFDYKLVGRYSSLYSFASLLVCAINYKLGLDGVFARRRNQGSIG